MALSSKQSSDMIFSLALRDASRWLLTSLLCLVSSGRKKIRDKARHLQGKLLVINPPCSTSLIESKKL
jgi:hypothetical protein